MFLLFFSLLHLLCKCSHIVGFNGGTPIVEIFCFGFHFGLASKLKYFGRFGISAICFGFTVQNKYNIYKRSLISVGPTI